MARIYKVRGGPQDSAWFWVEQVDAQGRPWNSGTGYCLTGKEAREAVERIIDGFENAGTGSG